MEPFGFEQLIWLCLGVLIAVVGYLLVGIKRALVGNEEMTESIAYSAEKTAFQLEAIVQELQRLNKRLATAAREENTVEDRSMQSEADKIREEIKKQRGY